jgi:hypothetical protein
MLIARTNDGPALAARGAPIDPTGVECLLARTRNWWIESAGAVRLDPTAAIAYQGPRT